MKNKKEMKDWDYPKNCIFKIRLIILFALIFFGFQTSVYSEDPSELNQYLRKTARWKCTTLDKEISMNIYFIEKTTGTEEAPVIVYVKNYGGERIGQESDLSILSEYIQKHYIIITVDFANDPLAVSPRFDRDLYEIFQAVYGYKTASLLENINLKPVKYRCFFLPAGYRLATDLVYWEIDKHAVYGTLKYIMSTYNESIAEGKIAGRKPVTSPEEMTDKDGKPLDYKIRMDIVYPSKAKKKVPLVFYLATEPDRPPYGSPDGYRPHMAGFTMRGYAFALIGHCYNPVVVHYTNIERFTFTLDHWNGLGCYTSAIRYIRANADKYNINSKYIGGMGHSKGEYSVTRLSNPHNAGQKEDQKYKNEPDGTPFPQPYPGYPSNITVGYQSMGFGLYRPQYISKDYAPTIVAIGENEVPYVRIVGHPNFVKYLKENDVSHIELFMKGLGHELAYGYDEELGFDRYQLVHDFFDRYLKVEEKLPPTVLVLSPIDKREDVSEYEEIYVHFAPAMDEKSITSGIKVINTSDNTPVKGNWKTMFGGTKFVFIPNKKLKENETYKIIVTTNVKDRVGTNLDKEKVSIFKMVKK